MNLFNVDFLTYSKNITDNYFDLIVTDPPYRLISGGRTGPKTPIGGIFSKNNKNLKSGKVFENNTIKFSEWIPEVYRILKPKTHCYIMCNGRNLNELLNESLKLFTYKNILTWDKGNVTPNRSYMQQVEFILLLGKGPCRGVNNMGISNLIKIKNKIGDKKHPTEKPVELMETFILQSSNEGDLVLDPFMGCGPTGLACLKNKRNFFGVEIDPFYFKTASESMERYEF